MRLKQIFTTLLLAGVLVFSTTACGNTTTGNNSSTASQASQIDDTSNVQNTSSGSFDYDTVCQKVKLGNKEIPVPFTVKDLGPEYSIDYSNIFYTTNNDGTLNAAFDINRNDMRVLDAHIHNLPSEYRDKNLDDFVINVFSQHDIDAIFCPLTIDGMGNGTNISEIVERFGESQETTTDDTGGGYRYYRNGDKKYGITFFYEGDTVFSIMYKYNQRIS